MGEGEGVAPEAPEAPQAPDAPAAPPEIPPEHWPRLSFEVEVSLEENVVRGTYRVTNRAPKPIVLHDATAPSDERWPDLSHTFFTSFEAPARVYWKLVIPAEPTDMGVTFLIIPPMTKTEPGETREVRFRLPLPLWERSAYFIHHPKAVYRQETAAEGILVLQWAFEEELGKLLPLPDWAGGYYGKIGGPPRLLTSEPVPLGVPILVREEPSFERV